MDTNTNTTTTVEERPARDAAVTVLAIVGFIALIIIGIVLAIYAARYVPSTISKVDTGTSVATNDNGASLAVVPTISFATTSEATSTVAESTSTEAMTDTGTSYTYDTTSETADASSYDSGYSSQYTYQPYTYQPVYPVQTYDYGLPNLTVTVLSVGYIDNEGNFVADNTMKQGADFAAKVLVTNNGTNATGSWQIRTWLPTTGNDKTFVHTQTFDSLQPNSSITLTLNLSKGKLAIGHDEFKVTVDPNNDIAETNNKDNTDTFWFTIRNN